MKRRSLFQALMAAVPLGFMGRAKAEPVIELEGWSGEMKVASYSLPYEDFVCRECGASTMVAKPHNRDVYACDTCGATISAKEWHSLDYPDPEGFRYYKGYDL